jgi:hypothetical protein
METRNKDFENNFEIIGSIKINIVTLFFKYYNKNNFIPLLSSRNK